MPERIVTVYGFESCGATSRAPAPRPGRRLRSSARSGTYVRSLIADLGDAYCLELRRTAIGPFEVEDACPPPPRGSSWEGPPTIELARALERAGAGRPH